MKMTHGPKGYLNDGADGPMAYAAQDAVQAYNNTRWLYDYVADNAEQTEGAIAEFGDVGNILGVYFIFYEDSETGECSQYSLDASDITPRGVAILEAALRGDDVEPMFTAWSSELYAS